MKVTFKDMHTYNSGHNVLELYNVLVQVGLAANIRHNKLDIQVVTRDAESLKT